MDKLKVWWHTGRYLRNCTGTGIPTKSVNNRFTYWTNGDKVVRTIVGLLYASLMIALVMLPAVIKIHFGVEIR